MRKIMFHKTAVLLFSALSGTLLVGCSSGDSNSRPSSGLVNTVNETPEKPEVTQRVIQGNIVKGLVDGAHVNIYEVRDNQVSGSAIGSAVTDSNGRFEVSLPAQGVADLLYVEAVGASGSRMRCDAESCGTVGVVSGEDSDGNGSIGSGEWLNLSDNFRLSSVISDFNGASSFNLSLTPLAHFATQRAIQLGEISRAGFQTQMQTLSSALNLPSTLSQLRAVDVTTVTYSDTSLSVDELGAIEYGLHSAAIARYAAVHQITIEEAISSIGEHLYLEGGLNRELVLEMLEFALREGRRNARGNPHLQQLLTQLQLVINQHRCEYIDPEGPTCDPIVVEPPEPEENDLATVKALVGDFRGWARELALQSETSLSNFESRMRAVGKVWEDDIKVLGSALNDILPGVSQALSPAYDFCYYCEDDGVPFYGSGGEKILNLGNLEYRLSSDGELIVVGSVRDTTVDVRLQLPPPDSISESHGIEMLAGRVSKDDMDLIIGRDSYISAQFADGLTFADLANAANESGVAVPVPTDLAINLNFSVKAEYGISPGGLIDFEGDEVPAWLDVDGWQIVDGKAQSGSYSLRSAPIGNSETTQVSADIETLGGYLTFNYALASEDGYDFFTVYVDGEPVLSASGYQPEFKAAQIFLSPGTHNIVWEYGKDEEIAHNVDAVWLDAIQFPALASDDGPIEMVSQNILEGFMRVTAHKLNQPWYVAGLGYLPGEIQVDASFSNDFMDRGSVGSDEVSFSLAASIANAADFVPPVALDYLSLAQVGEYTVTDDLFTYQLPGWEIQISPADEGMYLYEVYSGEESEPTLSYTQASQQTALHLVAGELIENSGVGLQVTDPYEGLYLTTVLGASPWGDYDSSQFDASGGTIFGYLVEPYEPRESEDRYLQVAVSFEIGVNADGLPSMVLGGNFTRESLRESEFRFYVRVDENRFNFLADGWYTLAPFGDDRSTLDVRSPRFELVNQDGVELKLSLGDVEDVSSKKRLSQLQGEIVYNDEVYGTLTRKSGITFIEYVDGSGESLE